MTLRCVPPSPLFGLQVEGVDLACGVGDVVMRDTLSMPHPATLADLADPRMPWRITVESPGGLPA